MSVRKIPFLMVLIVITLLQFEYKSQKSSRASEIKIAQNTQLNLQQDASIQVFFNHNQTNTYIDPYRKVERKGDNLEQQVIQQIASARQSIDIAVQAMNLPLIAQAIVERQKAGVKIRWITDNSYVKPWGTMSLEELVKLSSEEQDIAVEFTDVIDADGDGLLSPEEITERDVYTLFKDNNVPWIDDTADGSKGSGLMHHKFMVVDNQKVITGSVNYTLSGMHGDMWVFDSFGNAEHLLIVDSPELAALYTQEFDLMWGDGPGGKFDSLFGVKKTERPFKSIQIGESKVQLHFSPAGAKIPYERTSNGAISTVLNQAQKSIDLALFVFTEQGIANLLGHLYEERGVQVRGVFDSSFAYQSSSSTLDMWGVKLADAQCKMSSTLHPWKTPVKDIGIPKSGSTDKLHHKFGIIDDSIVITGSHNWSQAANQTNDENVLVVNSPIVASHFKREMERLLSGATLGPDVALQNKIQQTTTRCGVIPTPPLPPAPSLLSQPEL
jgi:phosphatidylserine/phosphatidylglycerophosphate/cardiolipin synthase-like enzyme